MHYELSKTNVCKDKQDKLYGENKYRVKEKKKKKKEGCDTPGITAEMQEENSACHKTSTLTNHHSSTAQSVGFPKAATGSKSTLWDIHHYPTASLGAQSQSTQVRWTATVHKPEQKKEQEEH